MKIITSSALLLIGIFYSVHGFGQAKILYQDPKGNIKDEQSYKAQKEKALKAMKEISKKMDIYEELTQEYNSSDSIVYSYNWHFTENVKRTKLEIERKKALIGKEYPIKNAKTLSGELINISDLKGKPTLINLWFTSCAPCIDEMPTLNKMKAEHEDKFNFLSITFESEQEVKKFLQKYDFEFEHITDSEALTTELGFEGFPANLFLDKEGVLKTIKGNIPYEKNTKGELEVSDGSEFIKILEALL